ncbi:phosphate regulon transcriptional regulator PhoB [Rickettsiales bacterium]|nr:phosphate regulon transcriptional regulator PhoB [Rickettsiales bacterium]
MQKYKMKPSVIVVEDDEAIITLLQYNLEKEGFDVRITDDGEEVVIMAEEKMPDVVLLDWMLPGMSGLQICNALRGNPETKNVPIIMISARGEEGDRIEGLERGADDYLVKPFSPKELIARINAVFRRVRPVFVAKELTFGSINLNLDSRSVMVGKDIKHLGPIEFKLLQSLLEYPQRVLSREQLMRRIWGCDLQVEPRTVDVHINRLRKALNLGKDGTTIQTVRSAGYCLKKKQDDDKDLSIVDDSEISLEFEDDYDF